MGTLISSDGHNDVEIASRIAQTNKEFSEMKSILTKTTSRFAQEKEPWSAILNPFLCVDANLDNFKTGTKGTGGNRNVVPTRMLRIS